MERIKQENNQVQRWRDDLFQFNDDVFGYHLWSAQRKICQAIKDGHTRIAIRACHSVSKSFTCGFLASWNTSCFNPTLTITTAPTHRQVNDVIWKEIRSNYYRSKVLLSPSAPLSGSPSWNIAHNQRAFGVSSNKPDRIQGEHEGEGRVFVIGDEACGIDSETYPAIDSLVSTSQDILVLVGNPDFRHPPFMRCFSDPAFYSMSISAYDSPNFTGEKVPQKIKDALVSREWVAEMIQRYGEDSPIIASKVRAEFPSEDADTLIPLQWIEEAESREITTIGLKTAGCDVARYGDDKTVIYTIDGNRALCHLEKGKTATTTTAGYCAIIFRQGYDVAVDDSGVGGGVTDLLRVQHFNPAAVNFGMKPMDPVRFFNARSEMYWRLREWIKNVGNIPKIPELKQELAVIEYEITPKGQIKIKEKKLIKKKLKRSPDHADALALAVAGHIYSNRVGVISSFDDVYTGNDVWSDF